MMKYILSLLGLFLPALTAMAGPVLLEAEQFSDTGGWDIDAQSMEQMGSPYLLAHGLGVPVRDAVTTARFASPGTYRVWVRTRDWVAPWKAPGAPGKFQLLVDGKALATTFGTEGAEWHWQDGGEVTVGASCQVALHDLTGFEGRCDAVLFCPDAAMVPPNDAATLAKFRRAALSLPESPEDGGSFDLVVVGGGIAGTAAAVSAARNGLSVVLIQDRPVLGGNGSSEVRVWPEGITCQAPFPHIGEIVDELVPAKGPGDGNAKDGASYADARKLALVRAEKRITLCTEQRVIGVEADHGTIRAVVAQNIRSSKRLRFSGKLFADCTGDATVGVLAGADHEMSAEGKMGSSNLWSVMDMADPAQVLKCECKDKDALSLAVHEGTVAAPFPRCPWAVDLSDKPFPGRTPGHGPAARNTAQASGTWSSSGAPAKNPLQDLGTWFWESGFDRDPVTEIEYIRDLNLRAMFGAWDTLKNVDKLYPNYRIGWAAYIAGKRESRRLLGDVVLTGDDFRNGTVFPDACFPCSWHIDIHKPDPAFGQGHPKGDEFISTFTNGKEYTYQGPYWAPYRCLYSRNVTNLFMAGRDISVSSDGLGPVRVMKTCGMMGEIVGKAAAIATRHNTSPRGVYQNHLAELKAIMGQAASEAVGLIDSCRYADNAAAQAAWQPMEGTAPVSTVTSGGRPALRLPCNFAGTKIVRASWDRHGVFDLAECSGIRFEMRCPDIAPVSDFHIYFESGAGWYTTSFTLESTTVWNTIIIDKSNTQTEGKPAGWAKVRTIRVSAWRGGDTDTELVLSNITRVGVLGCDATVAILRADSVAAAHPDELASVTSFAESMGQMLHAQGIAYATLSDLDATRERLAKANLVILPYNPGIPDGALDALTNYLEHGGKLLTFYGLHPRLAPLVHIKTGNYVAQKPAGQFAALKFDADALPGAPPVVGQRSWNIIETLPVPGASRVLAEWVDAQDHPSGYAAMVGSSNCIAMSHVLLTDDGVNKQRLLLAMVGQLVPAVWQQAAAAGIAQVGRIRGFSGFDDAVARIPDLKPGDRRVTDAVRTATQLRAQAQELATQGHYAEACDVSSNATRHMLDAFCLAQRPQASEFRAFWCHDAYGVEGMTWDAAVKQLADHGFTAVIPNMLWGGAAFYPSKVLPQASAVAQRGDALAECVAASHKYKIQCHVWKVCWNLGGNAPEDFVRRLRAEGRLQMSRDGAESLWLCPSHPANQKLEIDAMVEVARNYDIDGLHFDYIRYQGLDHCYCAGCRQRFEQAHGAALTSWPNDVLPGGSARAAWLEWRRGHITAVVKAVREQVRAFKPQVKFSAAVFGNWPDARDSVAQDWKLWCERGYMDFVCPMDYTPSNAQFASMLHAQQPWAGRVPFYPGIGASATNPALGTDGVIEQILTTRHQGTGGFTIFNLNQSAVRELLPRLGQGISAPQ